MSDNGPNQSLFTARNMFYGVVASLLLVITLSVIYIVARSQPEGTTTTGIPALPEVASQSDPPALNNEVQGVHFRLAYPATLDTVSNISGGDKTALEVYRVARGGLDRSISLVVTIKNMPLSEESSYRFRQITPSYKEETILLNGLQYKLMSKDDLSEVTAFTVNGRRLAILSYTRNTAAEDIRAEAIDAIDDFTWVN